jgi:hypothetical protein
MSIKILTMACVLTFRQQWQLLGLSRNECLLLLPTPTLNLLFSAKCVANAIVKFAVDQFNWKPFGRVIGPQTMLMLPQPTLQIPCAASVKTAICAFKNVGVGHD